MQVRISWRKCLLGMGIIFLLVSLTGCQSAPNPKPVGAAEKNTVVTSASPTMKNQVTSQARTSQLQVVEGKKYSTREEVAAYIKKFHKLPANYITKGEAQKLGWDNTKGNLWKVSDQRSIGGDRFSNREGKLPQLSGRQYFECDIDYSGGYRGAKRIIYSNDGLIFYTEDHYKTFKPS